MLIKKYTEGHVVQIFDLEKSEWVSQRFVAGNECEYETDFGTIIPSVIVSPEDVMPKPEPYLPFDMVQP